MNDKFDELTKSMAQSVTRRGALKKFSIGLASMALASLGLANRAEAGQRCSSDADCHCKVCISGVCVKPRFTGCNCNVVGYGCPPCDTKCMAICNLGC